MSGPPLLAVEHLTTVFDLRTGPAVAVDDVSVSIESGETLGLVGESGSGKSVTALSIVGLIQSPGRIAGGSVSFKGRDLLRLSEQDLRAVRGRDIGFIFQEPMAALNPVMTIGDHIAETLAAHGLASGGDLRTRVIDLLGSARVPDADRRIDDYPHQLSGGLRQRALIALALACRPSLVIADEPTTALDVTIQAEVLDLLKDMKRTFGLSLLLITHDLGVVAGAADRVAVMYAGRIVECGKTGDVLRNPQHPYTQGLLASLPRKASTGRLRAIDGAVPAIDALPSGCAFHPRCPDRFEPCPLSVPGEYRLNDSHVSRCFLHDPESARRSSRGSIHRGAR